MDKRKHGETYGRSRERGLKILIKRYQIMWEEAEDCANKNLRLCLDKLQLVQVNAKML